VFFFFFFRIDSDLLERTGDLTTSTREREIERESWFLVVLDRWVRREHTRQPREKRVSFYNQERERERSVLFCTKKKKKQLRNRIELKKQHITNKIKERERRK